MEIKKNGKTYHVSECLEKWTITAKDGKLVLSYEIPKELCSTAEELATFVVNNDAIA